MFNVSRLVYCVVACFAVAGTVSAARAQNNTRPNILFIFADDHASQAISAYGDERKLLDTPNLDRLAKDGVRFDRCLVPNSICGPSRATLLTGKYSHANGFYNNTNSRFDGSQVTFPKLLKAAGCRVFGIYPNPQRVTLALEMGADGACPNGSAPADLLNVFRPESARS